MVKIIRRSIPILEQAAFVRIRNCYAKRRDDCHDKHIDDCYDDNIGGSITAAFGEIWRRI